MKTIFVPTSLTYKATHILPVANYLATKTYAKVKLFSLEKSVIPDSPSEENALYKLNVKGLGLPNGIKTSSGQQSETITWRTKAADVTQGALPEPDLIVMDNALVRGRYEIAADTKAESTKGIYASGEFIMDDYAEGTKGACAAHELPVHPAVEEMMKQAHCPVLTVVTNQCETITLKSVVLVTDGEEGAAPLFSVLSCLQRIFKFKLHLLHINRCFHQQPVIEVINNVRELAKKYSFTQCQIHVVEDYTYEEGIIHFADQVHPDMIALPVDGHKIISQLLEEIFGCTHADNRIKYLLTYKIT